MIRFSVIIPLYNKAPYVAKTIKSVLGQTFVDFELIVIDNGSTDGSERIVVDFNDTRLSVHRLEKNIGVSNARNLGVSISHAPYITFLDADDWWEPSFLEELDKLIERYPNAGIYGTGYWIVKNGEKRIAPIGVKKDFIEGEINYCQVYAKTLCMPLTSITVALPRKIFDETDGFPANINLGEDFMLWLYIALRHKVVFLNKPLSNYNQDVTPLFRGTHKTKYNPDTFMTFHLDAFKNEEEQIPSLKILLDRIRVYSLMNFRKNNMFPDRVQREINKVNFANVDPIYRFYYQYPYWIVKAFCTFKSLLSLIKQKFLT